MIGDQRRGAIFSRKEDLKAYGGAFLAGWSLFLVLRCAGILQGALTPIAFLIVFGGLDYVHLFATGYRTYLDPISLRQRTFLYLGLPIALLALMYSLAGGGLWYLATVVTYSTIFHNIRQQYGWMAYSTRKWGRNVLFDWRIDQIAIYNVGIFPFLSAHVTGFTMFWSRPYAYFHLAPGRWYSAVEFVYWSINVAYISYQCFVFRRDRAINPTKILVWATTGITYYLSFCVVKTLDGFIPVSMIHTVPYFYFVYCYGRKRWREPHGVLGAIFARGKMLQAYAILAALALGWDLLLRGGLSIYFRHFVGGLLVSQDFLYLLPLAYLPTLCHHVLDGIVWRTRLNPELARETPLIRESPAMTLMSSDRWAATKR